MQLYEALKHVKSEEDVKDLYIKALGLKSYTKGLIDIRTNEVWFEAKDTGRHSTYSQFTQLLHYVQVTLDKGEHIPPFLAVIDTEKAAIMKSSDVIPFLAKKTVKWGKSASKYTQEALEEISAHIGTHFVSFRLASNETEFIQTVKAAIKSGDIIRTQITPDNLKQVFDKWVSLIGREIEGVDESDYTLLFYADVMHDGTVSTYKGLPASLAQVDGQPAFILEGKLCKLGNKEGYRRFWAIYHRPPKAEYRDYLLERRDSLIPLDERIFKGAYYTALATVDRAYDKLTEALGPNWQKNYVVWDMCCGVGNLEVKHANHRNVYMSTLDEADLVMMKSTKTCPAATKFQYDYLNDDIEDDGTINHELTNKVPKSLRSAIAEGKKILVLINPPYAEAMNAVATRGDGDASAKKMVAATKMGTTMSGYGYAARELFVQFLVRITREIPNATVACFSKMKHIVAPNFEPFRERWNANYLGGFVVHSKAFEGLKGDFPIGFLIWKLLPQNKQATKLTEVKTEVIDKMAKPIGAKTFRVVTSTHLLGDWIKRAKPNDTPALPLSKAMTPASETAKDLRGKWWADDAIGGLISLGSDVQHSMQTALLSSGYCSAGGLLVTRANVDQVAVVFTVRRIVKHTWVNDRDQFTAPTTKLTAEFTNDCLIWMLFNNGNQTVGADGISWQDKQWSLVNHFIPYSEEEVGAPGPFESDFMYKHLAVKKLSAEAKQVLAQALPLWKAFFAETDNHNVRKQLMLNRADVGWHQVRNALKLRNSSGDFPPLSTKAFDQAYLALTTRIRPGVYGFGFLQLDD
ncbi:hypothetical protein [Alcaligenes aquatilis]|uniref:Uncharacterized protein n=1 Tax=Alcaligenes aquatilis TaxID=323284 RepID=A0A3G2I0L9_9BURK|nr:hypothetical protein [Alcaligenes aquatilis]AYN22857.1 hypothetical protein D3M96_17915 [Alcaligenes aquatilis]